MAYVFENICYTHIPQIKKALEIDESSLSSPWRYTPKKGSDEKGAQIDLLFDREDKAITICEIKYTDAPYILDKQSAELLDRKINIFKKVSRTSKQIFLAFISANGMKKTAYSQAIVNNIITLHDLFEKEE